MGALTDILDATCRCQTGGGAAGLVRHWLFKVAAVAIGISTPMVAQGQLDTLRVDSLMTVAADRVRSAAIAAAREDAEEVLDIRTELFGFGGVFGEILGGLAAAECERTRYWVNGMAEALFWLGHSVTLAWERSADGEMDQWSNGPEWILDQLEDLQERWIEIKNENREWCHRPGDLVAGDVSANADRGCPSSQTERTKGL